MLRFRLRLPKVVLTLAMLLLLSGASYAIPAFSRQYGASLQYLPC